MVESLSTSGAGTNSTPPQLASEVTILYELHAGELLRYAARLLGSEDAARDGVQEVFLRYFVERRYGRNIDNPRAWLYQVMRNYGIDHLSTFAVKNRVDAGPLEHLPANSHNPEQALQHSEMHRDLESALTARESDCLRLRAEGLSYAEIADTLGVRSGTVGALLSRVHRKILEVFGFHRASEP